MEIQIKQSKTRKILDVVLVLVIAVLLNVIWSAVIGIIYAIITMVREGGALSPQQLMESLYNSISILFLSSIYNLPAIGTVLLFWKYADKRDIKELGFGITKKTGRQAGLGVLSAIAAIAFVIAFGIIFKVISFQSFGIGIYGGSKTAVSLLLGILTFLMVGFGEETIYRAYVQKHIIEMIGKRWGLVIAAIIFMAAHLLTYAKVLDFVDVFFAGILLGYAYILTESIYLSAVFHFMWDLLQINVFRIQPYEYYKGPALMLFSNKGDLILGNFNFGNRLELAFIAVEIIILALMYIFREKLKNLSNK